jgi:hypothetical protein
MRSRPLVVTSGTVVLALWASTAVAGPPPPPPPPGDAPTAAEDSGRPAGVPVTGDAGAGTVDGRPVFTGASAGEAGTPEDPFADSREASEEAKASWGYSSGEGGEPLYVAPEVEELIINPIGYYQGVTLAGENAPPFAPQNLGLTPAVMTWVGFERGDGVSRVFVQVSAAVAHQVEQGDLRWSIRLPSTSVNVRNNQRRLDTSFFKTPVTEVQIRRAGADTVLVLALRRDAVPNVSWRPGSNGYQLLVMEFADEVGVLPAAPATGG